MLKKEYGGFIEFESFQGTLFHDEAIALNCGRNALAYICEAKKIRKLYLPYFICSSVSDVCKRMGMDIEYYHIGDDFFPRFSKKILSDEYLYIVNFYGQLDNDCLSKMKNLYDNIIVDNAHSYFQMPIDNIDTLYTCRKYFGVADGAFLYTNTRLIQSIPRDESFDRMRFLLGRYEHGPNEFYGEYVANNKMFATEPIKEMSLLTKNLLRGIDYKYVGERRMENFLFLNDKLSKINKLNVSVPYGAFMYPLFISDGRMFRSKLQENRIYIPTLWPNVLNDCEEKSLEYQMATNILPIPVDQRYDKLDMEYLVEVIKACIS